MSFEDYANHISQKLKLAVSIAIIRSVPDNLTTEEYINQLKSKILHQMDSDFEISVCSDDFKLDDSNSDHNPIDNHNINDNNNHSDNNPINNTNLSYNYNDISINSISDDNIRDNNNHCNNNLINNTTLNNNCDEDLITNSKDDNINNDVDNNCFRDDEIDNNTLVNDRQDVTFTTEEENNRKDIKNDNIGIDEEENDIFINSNNMSLINEDYNTLIDEVLQLDDSQTILNNICVNDVENIDRDANFNNNRDINIKYRQESSVQATSNTTQTLDFTQTLESNDETYCENVKGVSTEKNTKIYQKLPDLDTKMNEDYRSITTDDSKTKRSNLKHDINTKYEPSPKRSKNIDTATKNLDTNRQIEDPNSRIKSNISKFLDKYNIASKANAINEHVNVKNISETVNKKPDQNNIECTQTNTYYSQSQPLLVIDQKYMYEKSKSIPRKEKALNLGPETVKNDLSISTNDIKATNINNKNTYHEITDKNPITKGIEDYRTNTIIDIGTEFQFERELYQFTQTPFCGGNILKLTENVTIQAKDSRNVSNNKMNATIIKNNNNFNKEETTAEKYNTKDDRNDSNAKTVATQNSYNRNNEIQSAIDLTQDLLRPLSEQNNNNGNRDNYNRNNNSFNNNDATEYSINLTGDPFSPLSQNYVNRNSSHRNDNNETIQSTIDLFSQQIFSNNNNRNIDNTNRNTSNNVMQSTAPNNNNRNTDNNNRDRNNNNNETTIQSTDLTRNSSNNLPIDNLKQSDEIINQSRSSDTDLTDSDEVQTEEVIPFKIVEELNKIKVYLNRTDRGTKSSSDTGYKSDSQSRHSLKMSQSNAWLNQSAYSLFTYITSCPLVANTQEITSEISIVLAELIQKLHIEETYLSFLEEMLDTVDSLLHSVLDENSQENEFFKKDETMERILLLNKSIHIQKYTIEKITHILENIHTNITTKDALYEAENIQKIENSCYIFHILHIILQRYYKNKENMTKSQFDSQKSQFHSQQSQFNSQKSQYDSQKYNYDSQKSHYDSQKSQFNSQNSQELLKKTDISDIWRKKWNPNFKDKNVENVEKKCALTDCSKVLNKLIVSCMDGYSLIAYFALKCFNLMQS